MIPQQANHDINQNDDAQPHTLPRKLPISPLMSLPISFPSMNTLDTTTTRQMSVSSFLSRF